MALFPAWPIPEPNSRYTLYDVIQQIPAGIRERYKVSHGCDSQWPPPTFPWKEGKVEEITQNTDGSLHIVCKVWDAFASSGGGDWVDPDWVGGRSPDDGTDSRWWANYHAPDDAPYTPSFYKI